MEESLRISHCFFGKAEETLIPKSGDMHRMIPAGGGSAAESDLFAEIRTASLFVVRFFLYKQNHGFGTWLVFMER